MKNNSAANSFLLVLLALGLIWIRSGWGKLAGGKFVDSLGTTLTKFASNNPFPWYKDFLQNTVIPNSQLFGQLIMWGEVLTAITITLGSFILLVKAGNKFVSVFLAVGLLGGAFLNAMFWLASSYTSSSTDTLNLFMLVIELIGLFSLKNISPQTNS